MTGWTASIGTVLQRMGAMSRTFAHKSLRDQHGVSLAQDDGSQYDWKSDGGGLNIDTFWVVVIVICAILICLVCLWSWCSRTSCVRGLRDTESGRRVRDSSGRSLRKLRECEYSMGMNPTKHDFGAARHFGVACPAVVSAHR